MEERMEKVEKRVDRKQAGFYIAFAAENTRITLFFL